MNVLDHYVVEVNVVHTDFQSTPTVYQVQGLGISSQLISSAPVGNKNFGVIITGNYAAVVGDVYKFAVRLIKTD